MNDDKTFLEWPKGILCILILSLVIVSLDLLVEVLINPISTGILDKLIYRFGLMFAVSFVTFIIVYYIFKTRVFVIPTESMSSR